MHPKRVVVLYRPHIGDMGIWGISIQRVAQSVLLISYFHHRYDSNIGGFFLVDYEAMSVESVVTCLAKDNQQLNRAILLSKIQRKGKKPCL